MSRWKDALLQKPSIINGFGGFLLIGGGIAIIKRPGAGSGASFHISKLKYLYFCNK
ncbi:hypothetical protein [Herbaspirillum sp. NPDC087042]|uniref:hypothetical protein n=1 Tax=Herbaspirillum sp. NPDC087042 TaxID=3364004 RepID=UPI0037F2D101